MVYLSANIANIKWCVSAQMLATIVSIHKHSTNLSFLCATFGCFFLYSSVGLVSICSILRITHGSCIAIHSPSQLISFCNNTIYRSAYIFSSKLAASLLFGKSISQLISIVQSNLRCKYLIFGIGLRITGRIISHMKTKQMSGLDALCVSSFSNTILDCGYISFISSVGLVGLKVSTIQ